MDTGFCWASASPPVERPSQKRVGVEGQRSPRSCCPLARRAGCWAAQPPTWRKQADVFHPSQLLQKGGTSWALGRQRGRAPRLSGRSVGASRWRGTRKGEQAQEESHNLGRWAARAGGQ